MGLIDQMKYAKLLYLADVLEDISEELGRRMHSHLDIRKGLDDIVKDIRDTVKEGTEYNPMEEEKIKIVRLETTYKASMFVPIEEREEYEASIRHRVEGDIISKIKIDKIVRVRSIVDEHNIPTFTASLIVGIEKDADIPREEPMPSFVDRLVKHVQESNT